VALLNLQDITLSLGSRPLLDGIDMQIHAGEKISLLGRNGSGKSTLMKLINGEIEPDGGTRILGKGVKTALLPQEVPAHLTGTVRDIVAGGISPHQDDGSGEEIALHRIERALSLVSVASGLLFENLSAGMKRRVILGRTIVNEPDILLLDEPTNHLDIDSIGWLEDFLCRYDKTIFFVTHDRAFLQKVARRIMEIDRGKLFDWRCDYGTFLRRKEEWLESEETRDLLFDKKLAQEEAWIRKGIKARRTRNEGRVRALMKMREERAARRERQGTVRMETHNAEKSGRMIIEAMDISFGYDDTRLIDGFTTRIMRGDKIGIIGPNGCGKSTLIRLLLGELKPGTGTVRTGTGIETAYFDQLRNRLDEDRTVRQNVVENGDMIEFNGRARHVIGYLEDFLFTPDRVDVRVGVLSGGEKNRLLLAKLFTRPSNFLILDEPTNDLDIETIELLEELLLEYPGTLLLVSHDRAFLNNVVTGTFVFEGKGAVREYAGGYDDWLVQRKDSASAETKERKNTRERKPPEKKKITFREKKELESIPRTIEEKEARKHKLYALLADPAFYQEHSRRVPEIKAELDQVERELEYLLERWEELESLGTV
jgi:ABC transport system ATP-binding/permease protein